MKSITIFYDGGSCTLREEAEEYDEGGYYAEEFNEEASGSCSLYEECCRTACHPSELGYEECMWLQPIYGETALNSSHEPIFFGSR